MKILLGGPGVERPCIRSQPRTLGIYCLHQFQKVAVEPAGCFALIGCDRDIVIGHIQKGSRPVAVHRDGDALAIPDENEFAVEVTIEDLDPQLLY